MNKDDKELDIVLMEDEDGNEVEFTVAERITVDDTNYLVVVDPEGESDQEQTDVFVLKETDKDVYETVDEDTANEILGMIEAMQDDDSNSEE